jgi:hypothetical protein
MRAFITRLKWVILPCCGMIIAVATALCISSFILGKTPLELLGRSAITISPTTIDLGVLKPNVKRAFHLHVTNNAGKTYAIIGASTSCACVGSEELPVEVMPGKTKEIAANVTPDEGKGKYEQGLIYYTDCEEQPILRIRVTGRFE